MTEVSATTTTGMTWRRLLRDLAFVYGIVVIVAMLVAMAMGVDPEPFLLVPAVLFVAAGVWLTKGAGKAPVIATLVLCVLTVFMSWWLVFGLFAIATPVEFLVSMAFVLCVVVGIGIAIAALRRPTTGGVTTRKVLATLGGLAIVVAVVGAITAPNEDAESGDIEVVATNFEFEPAELTSNAGSLSFHLRNDDPFTHDLTIVKGTDTDAKDLGTESAPGNKGARLEVELEAGSYTYFCSLHTDMEGKLTIT